MTKHSKVQLDELHKEVYDLILLELEFDEILCSLFKKWYNNHTRIEALIPIKLGLMYKIHRIEIVLLTSALICAAFGARLMNDSKDKLENSFFYSSAYPVILFSTSHRIFQRLPYSSGVILKLLREFNETLILITKSEIDYYGQRIEYKEFLNIVEGRTVSAYLLIFTFLKNIDTSFNLHLDAWESVAYHFGMMTQIRNDMTGVFKEEMYNDVAQGYFSWPLQLGIRVSEDNPDVVSLLSNKNFRKNSSSQCQLIISTLVQLGIPEQLKKMYLGHLNEAMKSLEILGQDMDVHFFKSLLMNASKDIDTLFNLESPGYNLFRPKAKFDTLSPSREINQLLKK